MNDSNYAIKFTILIVAAFTTKGKDTQALTTDMQAEHQHNFLVSILVFVRESYLFLYLLSYEESKSIKNEYDEYFKPWMWVDVPWY